MAIDNVYDAVNTIHHNLLNGYKLGFFHWFSTNRQNLVPNIRLLEQAISVLKQQNVIDDPKKIFVINTLASFLSELETFYSMHTNSKELQKLSKILQIEDEKEPSLKDVNQKLIDVANWVMDNSVGVKMKRIVKTIDPELEFSGIAGMGEFGVVLIVIKNNMKYALKIAKQNNEVIQLQHPVLGNFKRTLKQEFAIMNLLWNHHFQEIPRPIQFYSKSPCFEGEKMGGNAFLMEYLDDANTPRPRSLSFSEYNHVQRMVRAINDLGYVIPLDFKGNLKITKHGLKIIDVIGLSKLNKTKEQEIKLFQSQILKEIETFFSD